MRTFDISQAFIVGKAIILCVATSRRLLSTIMRPCTTKVVREGERESGREGVCVGKRDTDRPHEVWDQSCSVVPLSTVSLPACYRTCQHIVFTCKYLHANYLSLPIAVQPNADTCCSRQAQACSRRQTPHTPKNNIVAHAQGKHKHATR